MAGARRKPSAERRPFLFLGSGFGTSRKCLECQLCFARPPSADERGAIERLLPPALTYVKTWAPRVLNFGSDDALEYRVSGRPKKPTRAEWEAFCEDVERRALEIHAVCPIELFVKHDDGEYGRRLGPWHRASVEQIATRFHELTLASNAGPELVAVCGSVLAMLAASRRKASEPAQRKLVEWSAKIASFGGPYAGQRIVDATIALVPEGVALSAELASALFCHPTQKLVARLGHRDLVRRATDLLSSATPATAGQVLETLLGWMILDEAGGRAIGEALLAADSMKDAVEERSALVREGFAKRKPTGKGSPSLMLAAQARYLLETRDPERALANIALGLRFPHPFLDLYGLHVRALHGVGQVARAEQLATSDFMQNEAGPESPGIFYELARYHIALGRPADAIRQLRRRVERDPRCVYTMRYDPRLGALTGAPEFEALFSEAALPS